MAKTLNSKNIEKLDGQWRDFINNIDLSCELAGVWDDDEVDELYHDLSERFCEERKHTERVHELMFEGPWVDWFTDTYYKAIENVGISRKGVA